MNLLLGRRFTLNVKLYYLLIIIIVVITIIIIKKTGFVVSCKLSPLFSGKNIFSMSSAENFTLSIMRCIQSVIILYIYIAQGQGQGQITSWDNILTVTEGLCHFDHIS